jgi:hypothetical protein
VAGAGAQTRGYRQQGRPHVQCASGHHPSNSGASNTRSQARLVTATREIKMSWHSHGAPNPCVAFLSVSSLPRWLTR